MRRAAQVLRGAGVYAGCARGRTGGHDRRWERRQRGAHKPRPRDERARCPVEPTSMSELTGQPRGEPGDAQPDAKED